MSKKPKKNVSKLKRGKPFLVRFTKDEEIRHIQDAKRAKLKRQPYTICKLFDIKFSDMRGPEVKKRRPDQTSV